MDQTITFIGGGNMASALIKGLLGNKWPASRITVLEPSEAQAANLRSTLGVEVVHPSTLSLPASDIVVWAVKPQVLRSAASSYSGQLGGALHVSIAAGVKTIDLCNWLGSRRVVRAMPNTAAIVASGVTGLYAAASEVTDQDRLLVEKIVGGTGEFFWVESDDRMDAVTAISGSGPAYVFHFLEGLQAAAEHLGFDTDRARQLTLLTAEGAVRQALTTHDALSTLRERVTSRGGTTAAALAVLDQQGTKDSTLAAVQAAFLRAQQLANELAAGEKD